MARTFERQNREKEAYRTVRLSSLRVDTSTNFDLYLKTEGEWVLYRKRDLPFTEEVKRRLADHRVSELYLPASQEKEFTSYCEANLSNMLADEGLGTAEKTEVLYDTAHHMVHEFMDDPRAGEVIPRSRSLVSNTIDFMFEKKDSFAHFLKASSFDYYTYTHSVNVFVFSVTLAQHLGYDDSEFLNEFGMGALLHDIGKSMVPQEIINWEGPLSDEQWQKMKMHPVWGYEILKEQGITSELILGVTRHHHEKMNGTGYPDGLKAADLPSYIRISTVCDIFDALTTRRSYKNAIDSFPAFKLMKEVMSADLDPKIFSSFVQMMSSSTQG